METVSEHPLQVGDFAPEFALPAAHREGSVSLADYRGKNPVLVGLFRIEQIGVRLDLR